MSLSFDALLNKKLEEQEKRIYEQNSLELQALRSLVSRLSRRLEKLENKVQSIHGTSSKQYKNEDYDIAIDQKSTLVIRQRSGSGTDIPTFSPIHSSPKSTNTTSTSIPLEINPPSLDNEKTPKQSPKKFGLSHTNIKTRINKLQQSKNVSSSSPQSNRSYSSQHDNEHEDSLNSIDGSCDEDEENLETPQPKELSLTEKSNKVEINIDNNNHNNRNNSNGQDIQDNDSEPKLTENSTKDTNIQKVNNNDQIDENESKKKETPVKIPTKNKKITPKSGAKKPITRTNRSGSIQNNPFLKGNKQTNRKRRNSSAKTSTGNLLSSTGTGGSRVKTVSQINPKIGNRYLLLDDRYGICKYYNSKLKVLGIHLEVGEGNCDGTNKKGLRRFKCPKNKGIFVKIDQIQRDCGKP